VSAIPVPTTGGPWRLDGRVALVTGATRGIGRAIAEQLVAAGASVCITGRKPEALAEAVAALGAGGGRIAGHLGSAGDPEVAAGAVATCVSELGRLDVLVNNAGTNAHYGPLVEAPHSAVRKNLEVNVESPLWHVQAAWRAWMSEHGGVVLNVASVGALRPGADIGAYNVSKAGLVHLTRQLALELAPKVRVNAIAPGIIRTAFSRALWEDEAATAARIPVAHIGEPADCAAAALYLVSDASSFVTGETLVIDGGVIGAGGGPR
jgi:NAD(P)-dependent dehydrogenase (short-subunit alcohol dehydrogenase family)